MVENYYKADGYQARDSVGYLIRRTSRLLTLDIEKIFANEDVTFTQYVILMNLRDGIVSTCAEMSHMVSYDSGALTRVIDQLEERGLLKRNRSTDDRRVVTLELTPEGLGKANSLVPQLVGYYNYLLKDFTREEADTLRRLLEKLDAAVGGKCDRKG